MLEKLSDKPEDICQNLERGYELQRFNRIRCGMRYDDTSNLSRCCGYADPPAGRFRIKKPSEEILEAMKLYDLPGYFKIGFEDAMKMRRNDWLRIRRYLDNIPQRQTPDVMTEIRDILKMTIDAFVSGGKQPENKAPPGKR